LFCFPYIIPTDDGSESSFQYIHKDVDKGEAKVQNLDYIVDVRVDSLLVEKDLQSNGENPSDNVVARAQQAKSTS
jgi:hypothetical protein